MHTCPRRMAGFGPWERVEGLDDFRPDHGVIGQSRGCTFCGSMPPDDFLAAVRAGAEIGPTDKSYKLYVSQPNPEPDKLHPLSATPRGSQLRASNLTELPWHEMSGEQRDEALKIFGDDASDRYGSIGFGTRPTLDGKFYTQHLSPEQSAEFWDLWQSGQVRWGYPGGPYRPLYLPGLSERAAGTDA